MSNLQQLDEALFFLNKKNNISHSKNNKEDILPEIEESVKQIRTICKELSSESKWDKLIKSTLDKEEDYNSSVYPSFKQSIYVDVLTNKYIEFSCFDGDQAEAIFCEDIIEKYSKELEKRLKKVCNNIESVKALTGEDHSDIIYIIFK